MHSTAEVTALTIAPAAVLEAVALNAEAAVTSFARDAVQRAQMTAPDPAAVVVVVALAFCGANRDERRNQNGDNASFCTECRCRNGRILSQESSASEAARKENIEADDWSVLLAATPNNEDKLLWCLGYTGTLCALDATDFDDWVVYCSTVVLSALEACGVEAPDERKNLLSIGLAARTFNFSGNPVTKNLKCAETIQGAASYNCTEDADIFSMWYLLQVLTEYLRLDFNGNLRELIDAMKTMNKIRDRYRQIADRLPKMDAC